MGAPLKPDALWKLKAPDESVRLGFPGLPASLWGLRQPGLVKSLRVLLSTEASSQQGEGHCPSSNPSTMRCTCAQGCGGPVLLQASLGPSRVTMKQGPAGPPVLRIPPGCPAAILTPPVAELRLPQGALSRFWLLILEDHLVDTC